jgi:hypothetical protein
MKPSWTRAEYEREKRNFIQTRLRFRLVYFHSALIFSATWLSGWLFSAVLLKLGLVTMPLRYAISFVLAYAVFLGAVRVWADFMRSEHGSGSSSWADGGFNMPVVDAEGCLLALGATLMACVAAALFALSGGLPLLLEAAFEVVFAGVMVRRLSGVEVVGDWAGTLLRKTWRHALVTLALLVALAAWLQQRAPEAKTFAEALKTLRVKAAAAG